MAGRIVEFALLWLVLVAAVLSAVYVVSRNRARGQLPGKQGATWQPDTRATPDQRRTEVSIVLVGRRGALLERRILATLDNGSTSYPADLRAALGRAQEAAAEANIGSFL